MDNVKFKAFVPTSCKASEDVNGVEMPTEDEVNQTTESDVYASLQELYFGKSAESTEATNPFSTLSKAATTPFGCAVDPLTGELVEDQLSNPYYLPTLKEITDKMHQPGHEIPMTLDTLDQIKENYAKALTARKSEKAKLEEMLTQGGLTSNEANSIKQQVNYLGKAVGICESAAAEIETLRNEMIANFAKEAEDVKNAMLTPGLNLIEKFNCGTVKDKADIITTYLIPLDHDGNGYFGDPNNGLAYVDASTGGKALYSESSSTYIIRCAASGLFVTDKMPLPTTPWNICGAGLMNNGMATIGDENLVLEVDASTMTEKTNIADAKVQMNVPEFMVVRSDGSGEPETTTTDDELHYLPPLPADGTTVIDPASDPSKYCAVRITSLVIESDDNGLEEKTDRNGYDMIYKYMAGDVVAYQIRVTGRNGGYPASDYAHAVNSGDFPITVDASYATFTGSHCISDGKMDEIRKEYLATDEEISEKAGEKAQMALDAFRETMDHFQTTNGHVEEGSKYTTGIIIQGRGHFIGADGANNLYLVKSPEKIKGKEDFTKSTIIVNSDDTNYNAVFANGNGNVFAQNVTLAHITSTDKNATIGLTMKVNIDTVLEEGGDIDVDADYKNINIKNYASIMGNAELKQIDNPSDTDMQVDTEGSDPEKPKKWTGDDYYNGSHIKYSSPNAVAEDSGLIADLDASGKEDGGTDWEAVTSEFLDPFDTAVEELDRDMENPYPEDEVPDMGGEQLDITTAEMDMFYSDLSAAFGFTTEGMSSLEDEDVDTEDIENPTKEKSV